MYVQLRELGYWETPYFARAQGNGDDDEWINTGWQIRSDERETVFESKHEEQCKHWLAENGYHETSYQQYEKAEK